MSDRLAPTAPENPTPDLEPVDSLISEVAALVGQQDDPKVREQALSCLTRAAARMNARGIWFAARSQHTWTYAASPSSDDEFGDDAQTLTLPDDWAWPALGGLIYDSNGNVLVEPAWTPWNIFREYTTRNTDAQSGTPEMLAIRSPEDGVVYLWPPIDGEKVDRIELPYFRRIATFTSQDTLFLTPESREALISGGEYFMVKRRYRTDTQMIATFFSDFQTALSGAKAADARIHRVLSTAIIPMEVSRQVTGNLTPGTTYTVRI